MQRPTAWLRARNADWAYHASPLKRPREELLLYAFFSATLESLTLENGMPTLRTARAFPSAKSSPSDTLPRNTAISTAPASSFTAT
jgi:UDP-N-acetylenolpyruvoylglucosamine reductase